MIWIADQALAPQVSDVKHGQKTLERAPPVAERKLGFEIQFGHAAVNLRQIEERIVAKAASAARGFKDEPFDGAFGGLDEMTVARGDQDAAIASRPLRRGNRSKALQEQHVIPHVGVVIGVGRIDEAGVSGKAGGAHAWSTAQGVCCTL